jgi:hypothetical protein
MHDLNRQTPRVQRIGFVLLGICLLISTLALADTILRKFAILNYDASNRVLLLICMVPCILALGIVWINFVLSRRRR